MIGLARECLHKAGAPERAGPSKGSRYRLGRFLKGRHPTRELALDGPYRVLPSELVWRPAGVTPARPGDGGVGSFDIEADPDLPDEGDWGLDYVDDPWPEGPPDLPDQLG